jgi:hypothetical protein
LREKWGWLRVLNAFFAVSKKSSVSIISPDALSKPILIVRSYFDIGTPLSEKIPVSRKKPGLGLNGECFQEIDRVL